LHASNDERLKLVFDPLHVSRFRALIPETFNAKELVINRKPRNSTVPKVDFNPTVCLSEPSERSHRDYVLLAGQSMRISFLRAFSTASWNHTVPDYEIQGEFYSFLPAAALASVATLLRGHVRGRYETLLSE
jgi:hypothetical protein